MTDLSHEANTYRVALLVGATDVDSVRRLAGIITTVGPVCWLSSMKGISMERITVTEARLGQFSDNCSVDFVAGFVRIRANGVGSLTTFATGNGEQL